MQQGNVMGEGRGFHPQQLYGTEHDGASGVVSKSRLVRPKGQSLNSFESISSDETHASHKFIHVVMFF